MACALDETNAESKSCRLLEDNGTQPSFSHSGHEENCYEVPFSRRVTMGSLQGLHDDQDTGRSKVIQAPDGGWGWMVVAASFLSCVVLDGNIYSFGLLMVPLENYYGAQKGEIAWCGSLLTGMTFLSGPIAGSLTNRYGFRAVAIAGSLLSASGFLLSTFSPNVWLLYLTYGIMGGLGFGMIYLCLIVAVGCYFTTKRALATGIALIGSGMGGFVFPPLTEALLSAYDWRGAVTIIAGIVLNCAVCGSIMRPLDAGHGHRKKRSSSDVLPGGVHVSQNQDDTRLIDISFLNTEPGVHSMDSLDNIISDSDGTSRDLEQYRCETTSGGDPLSPNAVPKMRNLRKFSMGNSIEENGKNCSKIRPCDPDIASLDEDRADMDTYPLGGCSLSKSKSPRPVLSSMTLVSETYIDSICETQQNQSMSETSIEKSGDALPSDTFKETEVAEIVHELMSDSKSTRDGHFYLSTTIGERSGASLAVKSRSNICKDKFDWLIPDLDFTLLRDARFFVTCVANTVGLMGYYIPFVYLTDSSVAKGITREKAAFLISVTGISNICGKLVLSAVMDCPNVRAMQVNNACLILSGIAAATIPFCWSYAELVTVVAVFNFFGGVYVSVISLVLVDMVGVEKLTSSFGFMNMFRGIGSMTGSPVAGTLFDVTKSYDIPFFMSGGLLLLSAVLTLSLPLLNGNKENETATEIGRDLSPNHVPTDARPVDVDAADTNTGL